MKKLIACLVTLTFITSCAKLGSNKSDTSANKYSAKEEIIKEVTKVEKKEQKTKTKKHGGSEVK